MDEKLIEFLNGLNIKPNDITLYEQAFTHPSFSNEHRDCPSYDRLEFLGDSLLDMIVGEMVFNYYITGNSGNLSKARSALVSGETLSKLSEQVYKCSSLVRYSKGELLNPNHKKIDEDVFEAFLGAMYLDQGFDFTKKFIESVFDPLLPNALILNDYRNPKGVLQETLSENRIKYVNTIQRKIKDDLWEFTVEARADNVVIGKGVGKNKKEAEINAAKDALIKMK